MNQEIVIQDFSGLHNGDLSKSGARLIRGGSWKKQRIVIVIPADSMIPAKVALSHWNLIMPPNQAVVKILCQGCEVGHAYSVALEQVLAHPDLSKFEFLLHIEQDNLPPSDGVLKLLETMEAHPEFSAVGGLYWCKGENSPAQIWGDPACPTGINFRPQIPKPETVQECCGLGCGFTLYRLSMFKDPRLKRPWFETQKSAYGVATQDLSFWSDARKFGYRCAVDTRVKTGHMDIATGFVW